MNARVFTLLLGVAILVGSASTGRAFAPFGSEVADWFDATVKVHTEHGSSGTGILVSRNFGGADDRTFLVLNKHLLSEDEEERRNQRRVKLLLNVAEGDERPEGRSFDLELEFDGLPLWLNHADPMTDVLAVDVTLFFSLHPEVTNRPVDFSVLATRADTERAGIDAGAEVLIFGYPLDLVYGRRHVPLVRRGMIASRLGEPLFVAGRFPSGEVDEFKLRGFLVDAFVLPGASGSPVVFDAASARRGEGGETANEEPRSYLLGLISRTSFTPIDLGTGPAPVLTGIGIVFSAETIRETIERFADPEARAAERPADRPSPSGQ